MTIVILESSARRNWRDNRQAFSGGAATSRLLSDYKVFQLLLKIAGSIDAETRQLSVMSASPN